MRHLWSGPNGEFLPAWLLQPLPVDNLLDES
jgi:hypothetical protein